MSKTMMMCVMVASMTLGGCEGFMRGCSSDMAESFGADWVVTQQDAFGQPYRCWILEDVSIANETGSDGIYWVSEHGNLVHLSGHYNRVQVEDGQWEQAFAEIGLTRETCDAIHARMVEPTSSCGSAGGAR